jgi:hypothetical protein
MEQVTHLRGNRARVAGLVVCLMPGFVALSQAQAPLEYQVKAAFLLNFTKFIEWPAAAFANAQSPITICILGRDPFGSVLDEIVQGETVNARRIAVQRINGPPGPRTCQVTFVGGLEKEAPQFIRDIGPGVLTVGEGDRFLRDGGMVALVVDNRRVRFDINQGAAVNAGLTLSSQLLSVARTVEK